MENSDSIIAKVASLGIVVPAGWDGGPYEARRLDTVEKELSRRLESMHRILLERVGGNFTFDVGAVDLPGGELDVAVFFGLGDPYDIIANNSGYAGQIPRGWYPFAKDMDGHLYAIADGGAVHHIRLEEER